MKSKEYNMLSHALLFWIEIFSMKVFLTEIFSSHPPSCSTAAAPLCLHEVDEVRPGEWSQLAQLLVLQE